MAFWGKVALITGGGSGMGQLAARNLADAGASVAALDINEQGLSQTADGRDGIRTWKVDMTDAEGVERIVNEVETELGPIDRVYNAAAIMPLGDILKQETAVIHKIMDINYGGLVNITKAALPAMLKRGRGDFISFSSMAGWMPCLQVGAYNASKFAVSAFTEVLYHENRNRGVRFACVCPPVVATPLLEQGRATAWPKVLDESPPIEPQQVLDAIEESLEKGEFWVFPGKGTRMGYRMRRFLPDQVWKHVHKVEGW